MEYAVEAKNLTKKFNNTIAVSHLNLSIPQGEIFGLVGPDGAGKTTLLRMLSTAMEQSEGSAFILGLNTNNDEEKIRDKLGYMPQRFSLYKDLTVEENINFFADIYGVPDNQKNAKKKELLDFVNLSQFLKRKGQNLSGGMQKKLALACSLIHTPEILILDEPTTGVDPISRRDFWKILHGLKNVTIIVSTPYMDEAERCDRIGLIREGKLLVCDKPQNIKDNENTNSLEDAFISLINKQGALDHA